MKILTISVVCLSFANVICIGSEKISTPFINDSSLFVYSCLMTTLSPEGEEAAEFIKQCLETEKIKSQQHGDKQDPTDKIKE
ncbi:MAG: hypothetical protein LBI26_03530 [Holosporales bacterium]|jgi:hypothetical protein|nr:hypothetical protein [Holosporales bacterium]